MKRVLTAMLCALLLVSLTACIAARDEINVISREEGSGTRSAFVKLTGVEVGGVDKTTLRAEVNSSTAVVMQTVSGNKNAIGYISLGVLSPDVKAVSVGGVAPSVRAVSDGTYPIARPFLLATKENLSAAGQDFMRFLRSGEAQDIISGFGLVPLGASEAFRSAMPRGKVVVEGSSSVAPVMEKLAEAYMALNPAVRIELQADDSSTGLTAAARGLCDIGMASRELTQGELAGGLTATVLCMDGIAVIVSPKNAISDLTIAQIAAIFRGEVTTWSALREAVE